MSLRRAKLLCAFLVIAACAFVFPASAQQPQLDALAAKVAHVLDHSHQQSVIVADFLTPDKRAPRLGRKLAGRFSPGHATQLGRQLADQFSSALASLPSKFQVKDRSLLLAAINKNDLSPAVFQAIDIAQWLGHETAAQAIILGQLKQKDSQYHLAVTIYRVADEKKLKKYDIQLASEPDWDSLFQSNLPDTAPGGIPEAGEDGFTFPQCLYCPVPQYTDQAFRDKLQGTIIMQAVIEPDGRADHIIVLERLGSGLDESTVNTVQNVWKFKPALGPDGKPAAVRMLIDVKFDIY